MISRAESTLERHFRQGGNPVHLSVAFCLLWIAAADGTVDEDERRLIARVGGESGSSTDQAKLLALVKARDTQSLITASAVLRAALTDEGRIAFLTLVIELAVTDGRLSISENHLCRYFADLVGLTPDGLATLYRATTGSELPDPGDPSSVRWWESRTRRRQEGGASGAEERQDEDGPGNAGSKRARNGRMSYAEACVVLGLRPGSTRDEITKAYRRAVQAHHPDRFAELGPEAQRAAHEMFIRIQHAYEVLM